jgi:hypothetical protein
MNRRHLIKSLALTAFGISFSSIPAEAAKPDKETNKRLKIGETLHYDEGLSITFLAVGKDHRCPINARCIDAGDAEVILRVKLDNQKPRTVTLHTHKKPRQLVIPVEYPDGMAGIPKSYLISVASLSPLPYIGKKIRRRDYRLKLAISTAV